MSNHGLVAVGPTFDKAYETAEQVEYVAQLYYQAKCIGDPKILNEEQMVEVLQRFSTYGQQDKRIE